MTQATAPLGMISAGDLERFLFQVGLLLLAALLLGRLAQRLGLSAVAGELCAGVLLGPSLLGHLPGVGDWLLPQSATQINLLDAVGQVGVLLLVGLTGVHIDLDLVRRRGATAARISVAGVLLPVALGVLTGLALPASLIPAGVDDITFALFLAVAMGVSAIPVIAKTLTELRLVHRNVGQLILCAVTVDDILGWMLLSVVSAMATTGVRAGGIAFSVAALVAILVLAVLARPLVRRALRTAARADGDEGEGVTVTTVVVLVVLAAAATHLLHLEAVFGALVCGIVIGSSGALDRSRLRPLRTVVMGVLAPLFFAIAGLRMDLTVLSRPSVLLSALVVLTVAVVGKFVGAYVGARLSRLGHWESLALGAGMNARGVIEIIIAMVGLRLGVLGVETYTILVLVAVSTSMMAPPLLRLSMRRVEQTAEERLRAQDHDVPLRGPDVAA